VADRLGPLLKRFRTELRELRKEQPTVMSTSSKEDGGSEVAYLAGIDALQESSQQIFDSQVERVAVNRSTAVLWGVAGTVIFWGLMAGPVFALYRGYFGASLTTLSEFSGDLARFPKPEFSMMLTSLLLSLLPTALFAMLVLSLAQSRRRVEDAERRIRALHHETIERMQQEGVLRLRWDEPLLSDAEFLLSAGVPETES